MLDRLKKYKLAYFFILPAVIYVAFLQVYPATLGFITSLYRGGEFVGFRNYIYLFNNPLFVEAIIRTFVWSGFVILATFVLALFVALMMNRAFKGKGITTLILLIPYFIPPWVGATIFLFFYHPMWGLLNPVLKALGLITSYINPLGDPRTVLIWIGLSWIWRLLPFFTVVILAGLQNISRELYEAASIDGANVFQRFRHVTLPQLWPVITLSIVLMAMWSWQTFDRIYIMTRGGPAEASTILPIMVYRQAFEFLHLEIGSAAGIVLLLFTSIFIMLRIRFLGR